MTFEKRFDIGDHIISLTFDRGCPMLLQLAIDGQKVSFVGMNYIGGMFHWKPDTVSCNQFDTLDNGSEWNHTCLDVRFEKADKKMAELGLAYYKETFGFTEPEFWELYETVAEEMSAFGWQNCDQCAHKGG